jgi:hypothetical protein
MRRTKTIAAALVGVAVLVAVAWGLGLFGGLDPEVVELQNMRDAMFSQRDQMSEAERRAAWEGFRGRLEGLTEDQRRVLFESGRGQMQAYMGQRMNEFFALPPEEQKRELDRQVQQIVQRRQQGDRPGAEARGRGGGPGDRRASATEAQRNEWRKRRLDRTDPRLRAQFGEYRRLLNERLQQHGQKPIEGRPPRG